MKTNLDSAPPATGLAAWAVLVRKDGVGLGVLPLAQQRNALALVWSVLPQDVPLNEKQVNEHLRAALGGAARFLDTDHVELRRWLVDAGWLRRDDFGREYRTCAWEQLTAELQASAAPLRGLDSSTWALAQRAAAQAERASRRAQWQASRET